MSAPAVGVLAQPGQSAITIDSKTLEQCLKSTASFGETIYLNICTGATHAVPWGGADWAIAFFLMLLGAGLLAVVSTFIVMMLRDL